MLKKKFTEDLRNIFESGKLKMQGVKLTQFEVGELVRFANSEHGFTTIDSTVYTVLLKYKVAIKPYGVGYLVN